MKRAFKLLSTTFLVFLTTMALANDEFDFRIDTYGNKSIVLHIKNTEESVIQLTLKNSEGRSVFNESLAVCEQNEHRLNLEELSSGTYVILLEGQLLIKVQPFEVTADYLKIETSGRQTIFKPFIIHKHDFIDLNMLCLDVKKVQLRIIDKRGHVIFKRIFNSPHQVIEKRFDLSLLDDGLYRFSVKVLDIKTNLTFDKNIAISQGMASI